MSPRPASDSLRITHADRGRNAGSAWAIRKKSGFAGRPESVRTALVAVGVVALVAVGAVAAMLARPGGGGNGDGSANGSTPVTGLAELTGSWLVVNDGSAPAPVLGRVRLAFTADRLLAETGCNTVRGTAAVQDGLLVAGPLMSTRMACEPALTEQERWVTEMLSGRPRLERSGPYLYVHWGDGERWWLGLEQEAQPGESVPTTT